MASKMEYIDNDDGTCTFTVILNDEVLTQTLIEMSFEELFKSVLGIAELPSIAEFVDEEMEGKYTVIPSDTESLEGK